jgi:hypothetical protein
MRLLVFMYMCKQKLQLYKGSLIMLWVTAYVFWQFKETDGRPVQELSLQKFFT